MLIKLNVENFRSIKSNVAFHTVQRNFKRFTHHIYKFDNKLSLLKTTALYGSNGSGKTTLFKALYFVKKLVEDADFLNTTEAINIFYPFRLDKSYITKNSNFKIDFIENNIIYLYELKVDYSTRKIVFEQLLKDDGEGNDILIFKRLVNSKGEYSYSFPTMSITSSTAFEEILPRLIHPYSTFLSFNSSNILGIDDLNNAANWFTNKLAFLFPVYEFGDIAYLLNQKEEYLALATKMIKFSTIGIDGLNIEKLPIDVFLGTAKKDTKRLVEGELEKKAYYSFKDSYGNACTAVKDENGDILILKLNFIHKDSDGNNVIFEVDQESKGTIVLMHLIPALILSWGEGVNYFIDDINTSLHPILLKEFLVQYLENNLSSAKGQLIFNSHEDFLLDEKLFRQDELWLAEKNKQGETDIFPLSDFPNVRFDLNLKKNYLNGKFGGVPFVEEPEALIFEEYA